MEREPRGRTDPDFDSQRDERDDINWKEPDERPSYDKPDHFERSAYHQPNHEEHRTDIYSR